MFQKSNILSKQALSLFCSLCLLISALPYTYALDHPSDNQAPVWYIWQDSNTQSSWTYSQAASGVPNTSTSEVMLVKQFNDNSRELMVEAQRDITPVSTGTLTLEFDFALDRQMDGTGFRLVDGSSTVFGLVTKDSGVYLEQPGGEAIFIASYSTSRIIDSYLHSVKVHLDLDNQVITKLFFNGALCAENKPFAHNTSKITGFNFRTSKEAVGNVLIRYLKLYGGYDVYEMFMCGTALPEDWTLISDGGTAGLRTFNYRYVDRNSLEISSLHGSAVYRKEIQPLNGKLTFEFQLLLPEKRNGVSVELSGGGEKVFAFTADEDNFNAVAGDESTAFYSYMRNVWYHFKADLDLDENTADVYLNGKIQQSGISLGHNTSYIDSISICVDQGDSPVVADDIILHRTPQRPDDYVPIPQKVTSDDYAIGMQMCPLWTEGTHIGWDAIKGAAGRRPLLGYYDEGSPEVADWQIKWMAESGIDFWLTCMYTAYAIEEKDRDPIKDTAFRHSYAIHKGFFNAEYSNMMDFAMLWENSGYGYGRGTEKDFFENLVPFWIEYYFKDSRYYRLNGRPVMSVLTPGNFFALFEGLTENDELVKAGIAKFRKMCIDAGVGDPIILASPGSTYNDGVMDRWSRVGLDGAAKYNFGTGGVEIQKHLHQDMKVYNEGNTMEIVPTAVTGFDAAPWNAASGFLAQPQEYKDLLSWMKNIYVPSLPKTKYEKQLLVVATWDEFGEGTYICPTEKFGFGYLNAIREVFIGEGAHKHVIPTSGQLERINYLTPQSRVVNTVTLKELPPPESLDVVRGWYFDENQENWAAAGDIASATVVDGLFTLVPSGQSPTISLTNSNIDLYQVDYVKIRMKANPSSADGLLRWTTNIDEGITTTKQRVLSLWGNVPGEFCDFYMDIGEHHLWKGLLREFRLTLGHITDKSEPFIIDSIEFLGTNDTTAKGKLKVDDYTVWIDTNEADDEKLVALRAAASEVGASVGYHPSDNRIAIDYQGVTTLLKENETTAMQGDRKILLDTAPVNIDGRIYVTADVLSTVLGGIDVTYEKASNTFHAVKTQKLENDHLPREVLLEYRFDTSADLSGISFSGHAGTPSISNAALHIRPTGNDPNMRLPVMSVDAQKVKRIAIGMSSNAPSIGKIYFIKSTDTTFNESKSISFAVNSTSQITPYTVNVENASTWDGQITQIRFDPVDGNGIIGSNVQIEYIQLLGDVIEGAQGDQDVSCIDYTDNAMMWHFTKNTMLDGWQGSKQVADFGVDNGWLSFTIAGTQPFIKTVGGFSIEAKDFTSIGIRMKNSTHAKKAKLYFLTSQQQEIAEENCFEFEIKPQDDKGTLYTIQTHTHNNWASTITGFAFATDGGKGEVALDYIKLE
jgi:hypothetical protein